jgi:hypothetical protein
MAALTAKHFRRPEAEQYRKLYKDQRWCGPHGIRRQALKRDRYTCQRCECLRQPSPSARGQREPKGSP